MRGAGGEFGRFVEAVEVEGIRKQRNRARRMRWCGWGRVGGQALDVRGGGVDWRDRRAARPPPGNVPSPRVSYRPREGPEVARDDNESLRDLELKVLGMLRVRDESSRRALRKFLSEGLELEQESSQQRLDVAGTPRKSWNVLRFPLTIVSWFVPW